MFIGELLPADLPCKHELFRMALCRHAGQFCDFKMKMIRLFLKENAVPSVRRHCVFSRPGQNGRLSHRSAWALKPRRPHGVRPKS